jgi:acetoin utilization deacetylase AcuC-like enzyme
VDLFYADRFELPLPEGHRFPMAKYPRLRERVAAELPQANLRVPDGATDGQLCLAHDPTWVARVTTGELTAREERRIGFPWSEAMVERSRRSVGGTLAAARAALLRGVAGNLAGGTHHAGLDFGEGYCVFNDVAVTARVLLEEGAVGRVAVVDCDVHQGNGTAEILRGDDRTFTFSVHGARNFPFRKSASDLDLPLDDGAGDEAYLHAVDCGLDAAVEDFEPDLVIFVAGADPWSGDALGKLSVSRAGLAERDRRVFARCAEHGAAVAVCMGGGYAPDVDDSVALHFATFEQAARAIESPAFGRGAA